MRKVIFVLVLGTCCGAPAAVRADTIKFVDGRRAVGSVTVTDETLQKVEYRSTHMRQMQSYPADNVSEVIYTEPPEEYELAQENLELQAFEDAAKFFKLAATDASRQKGLAAKCLFLAGEAYRRGGLVDQAVETFADLIQSQPESRYVPYASLQRGMALAQSGDARRAKAAFESLKTEAASNGYGDRWGFEADLQIAVLGEKENPTGALETYQRLAGATENRFPSVSNQAKLRIGRVFVATGQFEKAQQFFRTILENRAASSREIVAGAYNGLGSALRNDAKATEADLKEALYHHLRVIVSYPDVVGEQAEALYSAGKCFQQIPGEDSLNRSRLLLYRCINEYPDSPWALEAQKG